jgi:hypothetical protein
MHGQMQHEHNAARRIYPAFCNACLMLSANVKVILRAEQK